MTGTQRPLTSLDHDELRRLFAAARDAGDTRMHLIQLLCFTHALRINECLGLTVDNFSTDAGRLFLTVARLKHSLPTRQEVCSHPDPLFDELTLVRAHIAAMPRGHKRLFDVTDRGVRWLMARYGQQAGVERAQAHPHALKHSMGFALRRSQADVPTIAAVMGHRDPRSTMQYLRLSASECEAARRRAVGGTQ